MDHETGRKELQRFDWMRAVRNNSEYPDFNTPPTSKPDVADAQKAAAEIVALAKAFVSSCPAPKPGGEG
jgi:hypothetical protein